MALQQELARNNPRYEYFYDESNPDASAEDAEAEDSIYTTVPTKNHERERIPFVYSLGRRYHPVYDYDERKQYEASLFWWTYRYGFPQLNSISTDAGWGCMLRSAQMMLSQALRMHFKSRHWRPDPSTSVARNDAFVARLLTWFADFPSGNESFYSLHNMCAAGMAGYQVLPGDWYGPGTACHVVRDLVGLHRQKQQPNLFRVHVSSEGTVYKDLVYRLMTREASAATKRRRREGSDGDNDHDHEHDQEHETAVPAEPLHPLDPSCLSRGPDDEPDPGDLEWDAGLLLLVPHRLGKDSIHESFARGVARSFALPQSVGILGGRPRGARWFYGAYADGSKVLGLDPHTVQEAPRRKERTGGATTTAIDGGFESSIDLTHEYLASVHTPYPDVLDLNRMDPSVALGFYCRDRRDFLDLQEALSRDIPGGTHQQLVSFVDKVPDYMLSELQGDCDVDVDGDIDLDGFDGGGFGDPKRDELSDEEDYVLL